MPLAEARVARSARPFPGLVQRKSEPRRDAMAMLSLGVQGGALMRRGHRTPARSWGGTPLGTLRAHDRRSLRIRQPSAVRVTSWGSAWVLARGAAGRALLPRGRQVQSSRRGGAPGWLDGAVCGRAVVRHEFPLPLGVGRGAARQRFVAAGPASRERSAQPLAVGGAEAGVASSVVRQGADAERAGQLAIVSDSAMRVTSSMVVRRARPSGERTHARERRGRGRGVCGGAGPCRAEIATPRS